MVEKDHGECASDDLVIESANISWNREEDAVLIGLYTSLFTMYLVCQAIATWEGNTRSAKDTSDLPNRHAHRKHSSIQHRIKELSKPSPNVSTSGDKVALNGRRMRFIPSSCTKENRPL